MTAHSIFCSTYQSLEINTAMFIKTFIFGRYQCLKKSAVNIFVGNRLAILIKKFSNNFTISRINHGSFRIFGMHNVMG